MSDEISDEQWAYIDGRDDDDLAMMAEQRALDSTEPVTYEMYTPEGDAVVAHHVNVLIAAGVNGAFTRNELVEKVQEMQREVQQSGHGEVYDTEPEWDIVDKINKRLCDPLGWRRISRDDF